MGELKNVLKNLILQIYINFTNKMYYDDDNFVGDLRQNFTIILHTPQVQRTPTERMGVNLYFAPPTLWRGAWGTSQKRATPRAWNAAGWMVCQKPSDARYNTTLSL